MSAAPISAHPRDDARRFTQNGARLHRPRHSCLYGCSPRRAEAALPALKENRPIEPHLFTPKVLTPTTWKADVIYMTDAGRLGSPSSRERRLCWRMRPTRNCALIEATRRQSDTLVRRFTWWTAKARPKRVPPRHISRRLPRTGPSNFAHGKQVD